jgi:thiamine-phosphate pyrophosphorylase
MAEGTRCELITAIPAELQADWAQRLGSLVQDFRPAALILRGLAPRAELLVKAAQALDIAVLVEEDVRQVQELGFDGVVLGGGAEAVATARAALGQSAIIGAACPLSRHEAMLAAESGADFVSFPFTVDNLERVTELSSWWGAVTEIPVALGCAQELPPLDAIAAGQPDFVQICEMGVAGESIGAALKIGLASHLAG